MREENSKTPDEAKTAEGAALWRRARPHLTEKGWAFVRDDEAPDPLLLAAWLDGRLAEDEAARLEARMIGEPALLDGLLALRQDMAAPSEGVPADIVKRAQALRPAGTAARPATAPRRSLLERLLGFSLRPAMPALAGLALLVACAGAFEAGRYQAEQLSGGPSVAAVDSELPVDLLMGGLL